MLPSVTHKLTRPCHWSYIDRPGRGGNPTRIRVWICEHPYRTIRMDGPDPDCEGCQNGLRLTARGLRTTA
jgi:hypothetical protein